MATNPVLVCYDGSEASGSSFAAAARLLGSREAVVVHVGPFLTAAESYAAESPGVDAEELERLNVEAANERAEAGAVLARRAGFSAEARGEVAGDALEGVRDVADEIDAAVIVIGSRGLSGVRERVEGSLSHRLATTSGRPVLVVPPDHS